MYADLIMGIERTGINGVVIRSVQMADSVQIVTYEFGIDGRDGRHVRVAICDMNVPVTMLNDMFVV